MDRPRYELLTPLIVADRLDEARRAALADLVPPAPGGGERLALFVGSLFIRAGCRLDAGRRQQILATPTGTATLVCHCGAQFD
jgi:hypothetical protein